MRRMWSKNQVAKIVSENPQAVLEALNGHLYENLNIDEHVEIIDYASLGVEYNKQYISLRKTIEDELYIVINFSVTNNTESSIALGNNVYIAIHDLPSEISSKIIDVQGKSVAESNSSVGITSIYGFTDGNVPTAGYYSSRIFVLMNTGIANTMQFILRDGGTIPAGGTFNFTLRLTLTL